jgi:hypothetical protein
MSADIFQETPFEGTDLSPTYHQVSPQLPWESTDRYRKFTSMVVYRHRNNGG